MKKKEEQVHPNFTPEELAELSVIRKFVNSKVGKVILVMILSAISGIGTYVYSNWSNKKAIEELKQQNTIDRYQDRQEIQELKDIIEESVSIFEDNNVVDTLAVINMKLYHMDLDIKYLQSDFIAFKNDYNDDIKILQKDIKDLLKLGRMGTLPDSTFNYLTEKTEQHDKELN